MRNSLRLLALVMVAGAALAPADKKTDDSFLEINRDLGALEERVKAFQAAQKAQDDKLEALRLLVQQAAAASTQVSQDMTALQRNLTSTLNTSLASSLTDQQGKISGAVAPLASQMTALSMSVDALAQTVSQMNLRFGTLDTKLKDISDKVSLLNQPAAAPPPSPTATLTAPGAPDPNAPPPGVTRITLHGDAERDYASGYDQQALKEFTDYIRYFPDDDYSPSAGYFIGMVYMHEKDYSSAADAFQQVIEHWPSNNKAQDALYQKAMAFELGGQKKDAIAAFQLFLMNYPANDRAGDAHKELNKLTASQANRSKSGKSGAK